MVREDPKNPNLLYAGTEFGLFISLDGGGNWERFMNNYPTVRTDDIHIHPRDSDVIVATHGRSIWIADDITPLQQWNAQVAAADATLFDVRPAVAYLSDIRLDVSTGGEKQFEGENPRRGTAISSTSSRCHRRRESQHRRPEWALVMRDGREGGTRYRVQWTLVTPMLSAAGRAGRAGGTGAAGGAGPAGAPPLHLKGTRRGA